MHRGQLEKLLCQQYHELLVHKGVYMSEAVRSKASYRKKLRLLNDFVTHDKDYANINWD